jgi:hypothetical protein
LQIWTYHPFARCGGWRFKLAHPSLRTVHVCQTFMPLALLEHSIMLCSGKSKGGDNMATKARIDRRRMEKRGGLSVNHFIRVNRFSLPHFGKRRTAEKQGLAATHS